MKKPPEKFTYPAFTLLETLLALTLTAVVLAAASRIVITTSLIQRRVADSIDQGRRVGVVLDSLADDLDARLPATPDAVTVEQDTHRRPVIRIRCLAAVPGDALHTARLPARVQYRLVRQHDDGLVRLRLQREVTWLVGSQRSGPQVDVLAVGLSEFAVELFMEDRWHPLTAKTAGRSEKVAAIRVRLVFADDATKGTQTYVLKNSMPDRRRQS